MVADGEHRWRVFATDRRGQVVGSKTRVLRVDATPPIVTFSAKRSKGRVVRVTAKANDPIPPNARASGVTRVRIDWGDGSKPVDARVATHRYSGKGKRTIRVSATDRAGNAVAVTKQVAPKK